MIIWWKNTIYIYRAVQELHSFPIFAIKKKVRDDILQPPKKKIGCHFSSCFLAVSVPTFKTSSAKVAPHSGQLRNLPSQSSLHLPGFGLGSWVEIASGKNQRNGGNSIGGNHLGGNPKIGVYTHKMDGENNGKLYENGWFGDTIIFGNTHLNHVFFHLFWGDGGDRHASIVDTSGNLYHPRFGGFPNNKTPGFNKGVFQEMSWSFNSLEQLRTISLPVKVKRFGSGLASDLPVFLGRFCSWLLIFFHERRFFWKPFQRTLPLQLICIPGIPPFQPPIWLSVIPEIDFFYKLQSFSPSILKTQDLS